MIKDLARPEETQVPVRAVGISFVSMTVPVLAVLSSVVLKAPNQFTEVGPRGRARAQCPQSRKFARNFGPIHRNAKWPPENVRIRTTQLHVFRHFAEANHAQLI